MKILALDIYKNVDHRISKDTSGGYGTGNNFGDSLLPKYLKKKLKKIHDWSPMFLAYTISVLSDKGHKVVFSKELPKDYEDYDAADRISPLNSVLFSNALAKNVGIYEGIPDQDAVQSMIMIGKSLLSIDDTVISGLTREINDHVFM